MNRSNTLPIVPSKKTHTGNGRPSRSATTRAQTQLPSMSKRPDRSHNSFDHAARPSNSTTTSNGTTKRPLNLNRQNSVQTRYMNMLLSLDTIPRMHNIYISFFNWILLAGFVIFPGTFTSLQSIPPSEITSSTASRILSSVKHVQLLWVAGFCCGIGATGLIILWYVHRRNFVWLLNKIFLPGCLGGATGLMNTLVAVYSQQGGDWSVTAKVTAIATSAVCGVCGALFAIYNFVLLKRVKSRHQMEVGSAGEEEGFVKKIKRKADAPAMEPGSVV